jgi:hypothetical protein
MNNAEQDYKGTSKMEDVQIEGIKVYLMTTFVSTRRLKIQDDQGRSHIFIITGTYNISDLSIHLLSPQHLIKEMNKT